jgi:hypothetical protein
MLPTAWKRLTNRGQLPMSEPITIGIPASYMAMEATIAFARSSSVVFSL